MNETTRSAQRTGSPGHLPRSGARISDELSIASDVRLAMGLIRSAIRSNDSRCASVTPTMTPGREKEDNTLKVSITQALN